MKSQIRNLGWAAPLSISLSLTLLASCSSGPFAKKNVATSQASGARTLASTPVSLVGDEGLSEELSDERLKNYFDVLMNDPEPAAEVRRSVEQVTAIYYRAESQLREFDHELDEMLQKQDPKNSGLGQMKSYPKMLAYWEISHRARQRLSYVYDQLLNIRTTRPKSSAEYQKAHSALNALAQFAQTAEGSDKLALQSLASDLNPIYEKHLARLKASKRAELKEDSVRSLLIENGQELKSLIQNPSVRNELESKIQTPTLHDHLIESFVQDTSPKIEKRLKELSPGREPNSESGDLRFYPSATKHGQVTGDEYPKGVWSLTFDDGPSAKYSPTVLKNLQAHDMIATIFELATCVQTYPKVSLAYLNAGMEMANHSFTHPQLPKLDDKKLEHEVGDSTEVETKLWGEENRPKLFRCPYGAGITISRVRQSIEKHKMISVFWNVDTLDWQDHNPDSVFARAKKQMLALKRGIILFHDVHPQSVEASKMVMDWIQEQGLTQKPVGEVIDELNHE